jgi:hypothetical protein
LGRTVGNYILVASLFTGAGEMAALTSVARGIISRSGLADSATLIGRSAGAAFNVSATPAGRRLTAHSLESLERHGFKSLDKVDDIIDKATLQLTQADGAKVFIQQVGRGGRATFNLIIDGSEGIVTGMLNLSKQELRAFALKYGWTGAL